MTNSTDLRVVGGLLALSLAVGGAGQSYPLLEMLLQICALAAAAYFVVTRRNWRFRPLTSFALLALGAVLLLPLLQLVPLPPSVWTQIPGRTIPADIDAVLGISTWRPLSLDIEGTLRAFLSLIPAAVVFAGCMFLARSDRAQLLWVVLALALASGVLGMAQLVTAGALTPYPSAHSGYPVGLFVNRNHNAVLMLVAMPVSAALASMQIARGKHQSAWVMASLSAMVVLAVTVVGTTSRMGLVLLPVAIAASLVLLLHRRPPLRLVVLSVLGLVAVASAILASERLDRTIGRFSGGSDARFDYWNDSFWALEQFGLAGTGFGTFVPVYKSAESLDNVVPQVINHAHNEYLEVLLEGGLPAVVLMLAFVALITAALLRSFRDKSHSQRSTATVAAFVGILIMLAASMVDYPLRMPALSAVFAVCCALLFPSQAPLAANRKGSSTSLTLAASRRRPRVAALAVGLPVIAALVVLTIQAGISAHQLSSDGSQADVPLAGWSTQAHERLATQALFREDLAAALSHAYSTNRLSPINASAIRTIGLVHLSRGDVAHGNRIMQTAAVLGWRDPLTQLWAIEAAKASQEPEKAVQRAEALFRQSLLVAPAATQLLTPSGDELVTALAQRLSTRPEWRRRFFQHSGAFPPATAGAWVRLVEALDSSRAPVSLEEGKPSLNALIEARRIKEAQRLWFLLHARANLLSNGDFEAVPGEGRTSYPTHWHVPRRNRRVVRVEASPLDPDNRALRIRSAEDNTLLGQRLLLQPGAYRLSYRAHVRSPTAAALRWELRCADGGSRQVSDAVVSSSAGWQEFTGIFTVPNQNCPIQTLALRRSGATPVENVWIDDIGLERAAR
jgi:O-antigen ligase